MARDIAELGADVFDDTIDPKKKKMSTKKKNYIVGLSCLGVAAIGIAALYVVASKVWLIDYQNIEYLTVSYPVEAALDDGQEVTVTINRLNTESDYPENFRIPQKINGYRVTAIAEGAFKGADRLVSVDMSSIETIGKEAFAGCSNLSTLKFSNKLDTIGSNAFINTKYYNSLPTDRLTVVGEVLLHASNEYFKPNTVLLADENSTLPEQYNGKVEGTDYNLAYFSDFSDREIVNFVDSVFSNMSNLEYIQFPEHILSISTDILSGCSNLKEVDFSNTKITAIPNNAFNNCTSLEDVNIPDSITTIGDSAFKNTNIDNPVGINKVISLGDSVYEKCDNITSVTFPKTLTSIPKNTFSDCSMLSNFVFEDANKVNEIGAGAFQGTAISSFRVPMNVNTINDFVFANCENLTSVDLYENVNEVIEEGSDEFDEESATFLNTYIDHNGEEQPGTLIGPKRINGEAFKNSGLQSIKLYGDDGEYIAGKAEDGTVNFPFTLTNTNNSSTSSAGREDFLGTSFEKVNINPNLKTISESCFDGISDLKEINFAKFNGTAKCSLTTIGKYAFRNTGITSIEIPNTVNKIEDSAFKGCSDLVTVTLPSNDRATFTVGVEEFMDCSSLTTIELPANTSKIAAKAFYGDASLKEIHIVEGCVTIDENAFANMCEDGGVKCKVYLPWTEAEVTNKKTSAGKTLYLNKNWCDDTVEVVYKVL